MTIIKKHSIISFCLFLSASIMPHFASIMKSLRRQYLVLEVLRTPFDTAFPKEVVLIFLCIFLIKCKNLRDWKMCSHHRQSLKNNQGRLLMNSLNSLRGEDRYWATDVIQLDLRLAHVSMKARKVPSALYLRIKFC